MRTPGIVVRPLRELTGTSDFNEVFFDAVVVPADCMLGAPGDGWAVAMGSLAAERSGVGAGALRLRVLLGELIDLACDVRTSSYPPVESGDTRQTLGRLISLVEIANLLVYASLARNKRGTVEPWEAPIGKLVFSEVNQQLAVAALQIEGGLALLEGSDAPEDGHWQEELLYSPAYTIAGGSSEIMRNLLAERVLAMPRVESKVR
jgi:alkylation response protein AidB-like acyl-CoA dehydrogenase